MTGKNKNRFNTIKYINKQQYQDARCARRLAKLKNRREREEMQEAKEKMKIYVVGTAVSYADWMEGELVKNMEDADLVWLTGGSDINPSIYGEQKGSRTSFWPERDEYEIEELNKAYTLGKPIFGTCRGAQLVCAMAGGKLVQHLSHPHYHNITFWDGTKIDTTSLHHQLQHPYTIPAGDYQVLAWAEGLSHKHLNGLDEIMLLPTVGDNDVVQEAELVYYRKFKALGIQGHPEMMGRNTKLVKVLKVMTEQLVKGDLELIIALKSIFPVERLLESDFEIRDDERQMYDVLYSRLKEQQVEENTRKDKVANVTSEKKFLVN